MASTAQRPMSRRSPNYTKVTEAFNVKAKRKEHHQPLMEDLWHASEQIIQRNTNLHKIAFTIHFTLGESRRLQAMPNPASEAYACITRALDGVASDLLLVIEERIDTATSNTVLHAHGYLLTHKYNKAHNIVDVLKASATTGSKIQLKRGIHCADMYKGRPIDIGWCHYCTKDMSSKLKSCIDPHSQRYATTQSLKTAARQHRKQQIKQYDDNIELEQQALKLEALVESLLLGVDAANDDQHSVVGGSKTEAA